MFALVSPMVDSGLIIGLVAWVLIMLLYFWFIGWKSPILELWKRFLNPGEDSPSKDKLKGKP